MAARIRHVTATHPWLVADGGVRVRVEVPRVVPLLPRLPAIAVEAGAGEGR